MHIHIGSFPIAAAFGVICALIAHAKGRNPLAWFGLGFFFSIFALFFLLILPNPKEEARERERGRDETRRVREMVRKDRGVADRRHEEALRRLDIHDRAIGLDTRGPETIEVDGSTNAIDPPSPPPLPTSRSVRQSMWYYVDDQQQVGPLSYDELAARWEDGDLDRTTLVWREGMEEWSPLARVTELEGSLRA